MLQSVKDLEKNMKLNILKSKQLKMFGNAVVRTTSRNRKEKRFSLLPSFMGCECPCCLSVLKKKKIPTLAVRLSLIFMKTNEELLKSKDCTVWFQGADPPFEKPKS